MRSKLPLLAGSVLLLMAALLHLRLFPLSGALEFLERKNLDLMFRLRGELPADSSMIIVSIDDASLQRAGAWPWPRRQLADLLQKLVAARPKLIVLDVMLPARSDDLDGTAELAHVMRNGRDQNMAGVILPYYFSDLNRSANRKVEPLPEPVAASALILFDAPLPVMANAPVLNALSLNHASLDLLSACLPGGHINLITDENSGDNLVRWEAQLVRYGEHYLPSLPLQTAAQSRQLTRSEIHVRAGEGIQLGGIFIPTDARGFSLLNYYGPAGTFSQISAAEVLAGNHEIELADKIVFVGVTAAGTQDFLATSFSARMPGVEKLATSTANILHRQALSRPSYLTSLELLLALAVGALALWFCLRLHKRTAGILMASLVLLIWFLGFSLFIGGHRWLHSLGMMLMIVLAGSGALFLRKNDMTRRTAKISKRAAVATELIYDERGPRRLGQFEIIEEIGAGAMGKVYAAMDPTLGRKVAVKILREMSGLSAAGQERLRERFLREARAAGALNHPNIVTIYQAEEAGRHFYIAMEFLEGKTLDEIIAAEAPLPLNRVQRLAAQIASGLDYAHARGVIHRDIKPSNLMILGGEAVKILDFGVAHLAQSTLTQEGAVLGTPSYMSPEQLRGEKIDGRSDLFSLAAVVYEMATRQRPFVGENVASISTQIVSGKITRPSGINVKLTEAFDQVLVKALQQDREQRFATPGEFAAALQEVNL
ncbi:CHASE2 domain-containing protein [bacterium]|nr:CHASE2 domain-containing protein [bacterium]